MQNDTLALCQQLIQQPSVTPDDQGCQDILKARLERIGFTTEIFEIEGVKNLWAKRGHSGPTLCFAGHTDVVPTGDETKWEHPPYSANIHGEWLYGRGTADMKGALAAMITAVESFVQNHPAHLGSIAFLITSDEEGPAVYGTKAVLEQLKIRGEIPDWCLVGEPSCTHTIGDTIKVGRRGSLHGFIELTGKQGHVAYPHLAENPIHQVVPVLQKILSLDWGTPLPLFPKTSLQFTNIQAGTGTTNVIPNDLTAHFNCRYAPPLTADEIIHHIETCLAALQLKLNIQWNNSSLPFYTQPENPLIKATEQAVKNITGQRPKNCTGGGTSDGRFFALHGCDVVELGLVNETIHQINERIRWQDLEKLSAMYLAVLENLFAFPLQN